LTAAVCRAAMANSSSGIAVTGPVATSSRSPVGKACRCRRSGSARSKLSQPSQASASRQSCRRFRGTGRWRRRAAIACAAGRRCRRCRPAPARSRAGRRRAWPRSATPDRGAVSTASHCSLPHALLQHQYAERDVEQRQDEIAEAGFEDVAVVHAPDEGQPVAHHQQRRPARCGPVADGMPRHPQGIAEAAAEAEQGRHQQHGPDHAMGDDLDRRHLGDLLEEDRHHDPRSGRRRFRRGCLSGCFPACRRDGSLSWAHPPAPAPVAGVTGVRGFAALWMAAPPSGRPVFRRRNR
jgi:hypothetical protein